VINLANGKSLDLIDNQIRETRFAQSSLLNTCKVWDLAHLDLIVTSDTIEDDRKRKTLEHKKRRNNNIATGAIAGGLIDGLSGDDSILDGVLIGAAFGAIATSGPGEATAKVGLLFSDNESLTVKVNGHEYSQLQTIAKQNARYKRFPKGPSLTKQKATRKEMDGVLRDRAVGQLKILLIAAFVIAIGSNVLAALASSAPSSAAQADEFISFVGEFAKGIPYVGVGLGMLLVVVAFVGIIRPESQLRNDEKERYASLSTTRTKAPKAKVT